MKYLAVVSLLACPAFGLASAPATPSPATIQVTGNAQVSAPPNRVYIDVGVVTKAPKAKEAVARNAARVSSVLAAVRKAGGPGAQERTSDYSVNPDYQYHPDGVPPTLLGYTARHMLQVRVDDLARIGPIIDAATSAGANVLQDLRFTLRSKAAARDEALAQAAVVARGEAQSLAAALGLTIVRIVSVREGQPVVVPYMRMQAAGTSFAQARMATPIETGPIRVTASVTLTVAVAAKRR